jgi:hypothetical protein
MYNDSNVLPSIAVVDRFSDHHSSGHIGLDIRHSAELAQNLNNRAVFLHRLVGPCTEAGSARLTFDVEIVFQRDRQSMQRAYGLARALEVVVQFLRSLDGIVEHGHGEAVRLDESQKGGGSDRSVCSAGNVPTGERLRLSCRMLSPPLGLSTLLLQRH